MVILIDLDGTLVDTAHDRFVAYKDGKKSFLLEEIPVFVGAVEFIKTLKKEGHNPIIVSDSHPRYVDPIARKLFDVPAISLADKPNLQKTNNFINKYSGLIKRYQNRDNFLLIGDTWLDIELGRGLGIRTVLTSFYKPTNQNIRDGIGDKLKHIKSGPTYYAKSYADILGIIEKQYENLLALEAVFQGVNSIKAVNFKYSKYPNGFVAFRCLARQQGGECDRFARADKYFQIDNPDRTQELIKELAKGVTNYLVHVESIVEYSWDILTYVSDKKTTTPPQKMENIFKLVESTTPKVKLFTWSDDVKGSLRHHPDYKSRKDFIGNYLKTTDEISLQNKNIIIIDDQFTTSATAHEISKQLRDKGAANILFIAMFYLILNVSNKTCPKCNEPLFLKIHKKKGSKFYSCLSPKFGGKGCGNKLNI